MTRVEQRAKQEQRRNREWTNEFKWRPDPVRALEKRESGRTNKTEEKKGEKKTEEYQRNPGETRNPVAQTRGVENIRVNYKNRSTFSRVCQRNLELYH